MLRAGDGSTKVDGSGSAVRSDSSAGTVAEETVEMAGEMTIQLLQVSGSTTEATMRTHRVLIDRPTEKGGADAGPMGGTAPEVGRNRRPRLHHDEHASRKAGCEGEGRRVGLTAPCSEL